MRRPRPICNSIFRILIFYLGLRSSASQAITLSGAVRTSWKNSAQIQAQEDQVGLAQGDSWRRFIFNEPQFTISNTDHSTALSYGLVLTTSFPGKTFAFRRIDSAKEEQQRAELVGKKQDLAKAVAQAFFDCTGNRALSEIQRENIQDLSTVQNSLKYLYESGHSSQSDTIQAELQLRQGQVDLISLEDKVKTSCKKLSQILTVSGVYEVPDYTLPDDLEKDLLQELGSVNGDIKRAESAELIAKANYDTAWWSQLPDFSLSYQRNHYLYLPGSPSGLEWSNNYAVAFTLPILFLFHESVEANRTRSQAQIDSSTASLQLAQARADSEDAGREYRRSKKRLLELTQKDLSLAEALRESVLSAYRAGKVGFADLVLARKTYSDLKSQEVQLRMSIVSSHLRCLNQCEETR